MRAVSGKPSESERPDWCQTMLVLPDLLAIDTRLWVSPTRKMWSLNSGAWDGLTDELLALKVGPERKLSSRALIESALRGSAMRLYDELLNEDPFK